jgi:hypothetical protein
MTELQKCCVLGFDGFKCVLQYGFLKLVKHFLVETEFFQLAAVSIYVECG